MGMLLGAITVWVQPTCLPLLSKLIYELVFSSPQSPLWFNAKLNMHGKVWLLLMRSDAKLPKSTCRSLGSDLGVRDTLKKKKRKKQRPLGLVGSWSRYREVKHIEQFGHFCVGVSEWARNTKERARRYFSLLKLHTKKINWWSSHWVFQCYNDGELEYSEKDFATDFVVRLYLLIEIYLLYI